ncbi:MAG: hypothetical protein P4M11_14485, partial [Candidatus Pacebacteria bacterium]|nr:hypothetical protein [Candidatus Paceibacterota bacterium]
MLTRLISTGDFIKRISPPKHNAGTINGFITVSSLIYTGTTTRGSLSPASHLFCEWGFGVLGFWGFGVL